MQYRDHSWISVQKTQLNLPHFPKTPDICTLHGSCESLAGMRYRGCMTLLKPTILIILREKVKMSITGGGKGAEMDITAIAWKYHFMINKHLT